MPIPLLKLKICFCQFSSLRRHMQKVVATVGLIPFFSYMVLEQGALSGKFDEAHPFPAGRERARVYDPMLKRLTTLNAGLRELADRHQCSIAQLAIAWAIAKGTVPIIGVTKRDQVTDAIAAASVALSEAEVLQMEKLADQLGICVVRSWEEEMR